MQNKLIASTMTQRTFTLDVALDKLLEAGFDTIELCSVDAWVPHFDVANATDETVKQTAELIKSKGIKVHCVNVGGVHTAEKLEKVYQLAREVNAKIVTYACGTKEETGSYETAFQKHVELNSKLADFGDKYGIICSVEAPHKLSLAETPEQIDAYWAAQDPRVKCTFDVAHLTYSGADMIGFAKKLAPRMVHSHLRDACLGNSLKRYGEGTVDFATYLKTVKDAGYNGYFSIEYPLETPEEAVERLVSSRIFLSKFDI